MKEFFEEYGRVIVTVLIILGIILVGYTIAGNGENSAFGKFTTATVDSLSGQANNLLKGSIGDLERGASYDTKEIHQYSGAYGCTVESSENGGIKTVTVTGQSMGWNGKEKNAGTWTSSTMQVPWGKKSVMSFDISADNDFQINMDFNADIEGVTGNDGYGSGSVQYNDGKIVRSHETLSKNKWHHVVVVLENNGKSNTEKKPFTRVFNSIYYQQDGGTTNYQIKNLKYGIAD